MKIVGASVGLVFAIPLILGLVRGVALAPGSTGGTVTGHIDVVKDGKTVTRSDVWVYLVDDVDRRELARRRRARAATKLPDREIRQQKRLFLPNVLVVPIGTVVNFPNFDLEDHNVFSPTDPQFNLGAYKNDLKGKSYKFEDLGEMKIFCDIHKEMSARVKVIDSALFVPLGGDGTFTIVGVPPGNYKVHAWIQNSDEVVDKVVVTEGRASTVGDMHLQLKPELPHDRYDGTKYGIYKP